MPTPRLELGGGLIDQMGGFGAPPLSFGERVKDLFPYVFLAFQPGGDRQASNKIASLEAHYRIPALRGLEVYYELDPDDFDLRRLWSIYWQDSGHLLGATQNLTSDGRMFVNVELHRTSLRLYEHFQFASGVTYRDAIIGDPLGPNAIAGYATFNERIGMRLLQLSLATESRDPSQFTVYQNDASGNGWRFVRVTQDPRERRDRLTLELRRATDDAGFALLPRVGLEQVRNDGFVPGRRSFNAIGGISGVFRF
jgi:hypothetical protein